MQRSSIHVILRVRTNRIGVMISVESIIQQMVGKMVEGISKVVQEKGVSNIDKLAVELLKILKTCVLELLGALLGEADQALVAAKGPRHEDGLRVKARHVPRTLHTMLGDLHYERTYFETAANERVYLLDHIIGVEAYERISKELCAALVQGAADKSMAKAAKDLDAAVSRQTVDNKVLALRQVAKAAERVERTPSELHLFADEDHVHMKDGRGAIVPLVTVTEGIDTSAKRHKTMAAVHFAGYGIDNASFFEGIAAFLHRKYDMERVEHVYVHADGGQWIRAARDWLPNASFVMDDYHLKKRLGQLSRLPGAAPYRDALRKALRENNLACFQAKCEAIRAKQDERGCQLLAEHVGFFLNNWDAIVLRIQHVVCGSCTEPLVSHVLSERLSRTPLAWSTHGLRQMAMLRVYVQNGGDITADHIRISRNRENLELDKLSFLNGMATYRAYADQQIQEFLSQKIDWSIFQAPAFHFGKITGTSVILNACSHLRNSLASA